jgi:hypothetical protein
MERESEKVIAAEDLSGLISDADTVFSRYLRMSAADDKGIVKCFTCGCKKHFSLMQCGHYIKRGNLFLRLNERNCRPQCQTCNYNQKTDGEKAKFTAGLEKENPGITEILKEESAVVYKPTRSELRAIISEYSAKLKEQQKRFKK